MCRRVLGDSVAACLHPCWFNIIKLQACGRGVPDALIEFPKDSVVSRRSPLWNYKGYQDKLYPRGVRTRALRSALKGATPRVASQPRRGGGQGGPQANLVNLFVTAWRGQALTKSFNKISGPAGGGKSATSTCTSDPADSDGSEIKSTWHRGAVLPPESVAGVQRNTPAGAQAPRLYEAARRNGPPTDQSVDYSSCRLCKKHGLPFLEFCLFGSLS